VSWQDLLQDPDEQISLPWVGERSLILGDRSWEVQGRIREEGWYAFRLNGRKAYPLSLLSDPPTEMLKFEVTGYLAGNRLIPDGLISSTDGLSILSKTETIHLLPIELNKFDRVTAGRTWEKGKLIFKTINFPLGPEEELKEAFTTDKTINQIKGVTPSLELAFLFEGWIRQQEVQRRAAIERFLQEEQEKKDREERRKALSEKIGDGAKRRELAKVDFEQAAKAALAVGNAELIGTQRSSNRDEMIVNYKVGERRFQCVCHSETLRIIDAGICLTAEYDSDDFDYGTRGDSFFTLESLPSVIREAIQEGRLVVYRRI